MLLSNILTSVYKSTSWRLLRPRAFSGREWLPSGKGKCKTCKNEIGDWLGWRVRTRGGGEEIEFFIVFDIGYNKMDNYCTDRLMIIALWWWYCQTHNIYSGFGRQHSSCAEYFFCVFRTGEKKTNGNGGFLFLVTKSLKSRRLDLLSNHEICLQNCSFSSRN